MKHFKHNIDKKLTEILLGKKKKHIIIENTVSHMKKILCVQNILKIKLNLIKKTCRQKNQTYIIVISINIIYVILLIEQHF